MGILRIYFMKVSVVMSMYRHTYVPRSEANVLLASHKIR